MCKACGAIIPTRTYSLLSASNNDTRDTPDKPAWCPSFVGDMAELGNGLSWSTSISIQAIFQRCYGLLGHAPIRNARSRSSALLRRRLLNLRGLLGIERIRRAVSSRLAALMNGKINFQL